mmetsp:Transcript_8898/g.33598  ORF Transcript_8898/g.33598 Transcript_8898/m.33598 type:complete len:205 (+) Transcript_8898:783-1397(+)
MLADAAAINVAKELGPSSKRIAQRWRENLDLFALANNYLARALLLRPGAGSGCRAAVHVKPALKPHANVAKVSVVLPFVAFQKRIRWPFRRNRPHGGILGGWVHHAAADVHDWAVLVVHLAQLLLGELILTQIRGVDASPEGLHQVLLLRFAVGTSRIEAIVIQSIATVRIVRGVELETQLRAPLWVHPELEVAVRVAPRGELD